MANPKPTRSILFFITTPVDQPWIALQMSLNSIHADQAVGCFRETHSPYFLAQYPLEGSGERMV